MEETFRVPGYAKSKDLLRFDYTDDGKLELDESIGKRDVRVIKFLYYISKGNRIWYRKFDKEKGCYSEAERTNFSTLYDRFMKGELDLVHPLNDIIYVFGKIAKMCKERGIEYVIKSGRVSYKMAGKKGGKEFPPMIYGNLDRWHDAYINVIDGIGKESTFGFDIKRMCELIQITSKSSILKFHEVVYDVMRCSSVTCNFSLFLGKFMEVHFPKYTNKFDKVFKEFLRKFNDDELEQRMEEKNESTLSDYISRILSTLN